MAYALDEILIASALDSLNMDDYWPDYDSIHDEETPDDDSDGEYPVILLLYETLLDDMLDRSLVTPENVQSAIKHIVSNYNRMTNGKTPVELDYNDLNNCFGYLHRYAACHTALVRSVLKRILHTRPPAPVKRLLCLKDSLEVVSLGGGPGNDLVGLFSALYGKHYGFLKMSLTIVDIMTGWERVFFRTLKYLREKDLGNASALCREVKIDPFFIEADLTDLPKSNSSLMTKIRNADVLLMVKALSVVPDSKKNNFLEFVSYMKPGAILVFIDCPFPESSFSTVDCYLDCIYISQKQRFEFNYQVERFNYPNITNCKAYVRVYIRKF